MDSHPTDADRTLPGEALLQQRRRMDETALAVEPDIGLEPVTIGDLRAEWIVPPDASKAVIVYFHGGGFTKGSLASHREMISRIARAGRAKVLQVDYRLAPEHQYPAQQEDAMAAYHFLIDGGTDPRMLLIGGDSAGGGLALLLAIAVRDAGLPMPAGIFALSPVTDLTYSGATFETRAHVDPLTTRKGIEGVMGLYLGANDPTDPRISVLFADLKGLPPVLVQAGDHEVLLDDSVRIVEKARAAGLDAELQIFDGMPHTFQQSRVGEPQTLQAIENIGAFVQRTVVHRR
jgi:acetyl esterase/lipase